MAGLSGFCFVLWAWHWSLRRRGTRGFRGLGIGFGVMVSFSSASAAQDQVESEFEAFKAELKLLKELKAGQTERPETDPKKTPPKKGSKAQREGREGLGFMGLSRA